MKARRIDPNHAARVRMLRANATDAERTMWRLLCCYRPKFTRQLPIGSYVADLAGRARRQSACRLGP